MSGLGAPFFTATPTGILAIGVALPAMTLPEATTSLKGVLPVDSRAGTSKASPLMICCLVESSPPKVALTL